MAETHKRSVTKAITWRATGTIDTFLISWLITGELTLAGGIAGTEVMTKVVLFYLHERAWTRIDWGRQPAPQLAPQSVLPVWPSGSLDATSEFLQTSDRVLPLKP